MNTNINFETNDFKGNQYHLKVLIDAIRKGDIEIWNKFKDEQGDNFGADLQYLDLHNVDLRGIDLSHSNLIGVNLSGAYLNEATFIESNLNYANLNNAVMHYTIMNGASMYRIDLSGANLYGSMINDAKLDEANLRSAGFSNTETKYSRFDEADLTGAYFTSADMSWAKFRSAILKQANLNKANLFEADLGAADLSDAVLENADLFLADLGKANLSNAKLTACNLRECDLREVNARRANLSNVSLWGANLNGAILSQANLSNANLAQANMIRCNLDHSILTGAIIYETLRDGWSINEVTCEYIYVDRDGKDRIPDDSSFELGEFERYMLGLKGTIEQLRNAIEKGRSMNHVFISYVHKDEEIVKKLVTELETAGITVWRDKNKLRPGVRWEKAIRDAISEGMYFIACFSENYWTKDKTYMNEEVTIAIEQLRLMHHDRIWFIPVKLSNCPIPDKKIGGGE